MLSPKERRTENIGDFPTVLIAELEKSVSSALCLSLQNEGYNVLEAHDWAAAFKMIRSHSRPIHFLLTNAKKARPDLAETLEPYRPELRIVFIAQHPSEILPNVLHPEIALAKVQELLKPQTGTAPSSLPLSNDKAHHPPRT